MSALQYGEVIAALAGSTALGAVATKLLGRRGDVLKVLTDAYGTLAKRVTDLENRLDIAEGKLAGERLAHDDTRSVLRVALDYIRDVLDWGSDRRGPMPVAPSAVRERL